jgi:hypothetical protein
VTEHHTEPDENRDERMADIDLDVPEEQADTVKGGLADTSDMVIKKPIDKSSP